MKYCAAIVLLLALCLPAQAQPESQFPLAEIADLAQEVMPLISDAESAQQVSQALPGITADIRDQLKWSGDKGFLLRVRYQTEANSGATAAIGPPEKIGSGARPSDALARIGAQVLPGVRPGFKEDDEKKSYYWIVSTAHGLKFQPTHYPLTTVLENEATQLTSDRQLLENVAEDRRGQMIQSVVAQLKSKAASSSQRAALAQEEQHIRQTDAAVKQIEDRLRSQLEQSRDASAFLSKVQLLKNIVSVSVLALEAQNEFGTQPDEFTSAPDADTLLSRVTTYKVKKDGLIIEGRKELKVSIDNDSTAVTALQDSAKRAGAPSVVVDELAAPRRPQDTTGPLPNPVALKPIK